MTDEQHPRGADGRAPSSDDGLAPSGEALASGELPDTDDYEVVDEEAEELAASEGAPDSTPDKGDPQDMVIDDPDQLDEAEDAARKARSSRPRRRTGGRKAAAEPEADDEADADPKSEKSAGKGRAPHREITRAPVRRDKPRKAGDEDESGKRANPVKFTKQSVAELKKVKWPTASETGQYFLVVLVFVLFIIAVVGGLDVLFAWGLLKTLGD